MIFLTTLGHIESNRIFNYANLYRMNLIFSSLREAHTYIEDTKDDWAFRRNYAHALKEFQSKNIDRETREKIQWEIDSMEFMLKKGKSLPLISATDENGNIIDSPSYDNFTESTYKYFVERSEKSINPFLKARFNQILWNSAKYKNKKYAEKAIDSYITILSNLRHNTSGDRDSYNLFFNAIYLAAEINHKLDEIISIIQQETIFNLDDRLSIYHGLLELKKVRASYFYNVDTLCQKVITQKRSENTLSGLEWSLKIAIDLSKKCKTPAKDYERQLAECYEFSAQERMTDESTMIPIHFLSMALEIYQKLKDSKKTEEVALKIVELRKDLKLSVVSTEFTDEETELIIEYFTQKANSYLDRSIDDFFDLLTSGASIFPTKEQLEKTLEKKEPSFLDHISRSFLDINNNQTKESDQETHTRKLFEEYGWFISFEVGLFMDILFRKGIASGVLSYDTVISQFHKRTWLGNTFEHRSGGGDLEKYSWLSVLAPSFFEFFRQEDASILNPRYNPNYVMVIDSLTLKFEGVLRDFARLINIQTIRFSDKAKGEREMYIEDLLANEKLKEYFDENDRMLFRYIFLGDGINLRNNVAHCFLKYHDYKKNHIYLLIAAFLRLGKYEIKK